MTPDETLRHPPLPRWMLVAAVGGLLGAALLVGGLVAVRVRSERAETRARAGAIAAGPRVRVETVRRSPAETALELLGEARPFATATLYAKVAGYLKEVHVDKGDRVVPDQVLAVIDSPETDHQYLAAVADARNKRANARRLDALGRSGVVSAMEREQADTDAAVAEATVARLATLRSYEVVKAPFAGTVTARYADPGALVQDAASAQSGALPVVTVSNTDRLRVQLYVAQREAAFVKTGDAAVITVPERPELQLEGQVARVTGELDPKTRTLLTEVDFDNRGGEIVPGSFVHVRLKLQVPSYLEVPANALIVRGGKTFVATLTPEDRVALREVAVANDDGERVRLLSGVDDGARVALDLGDSVGDGAHVQPATTP